MLISSLQNQKIKDLVKLQQKSRERKTQKLFVVEGIQENLLALKNNYEVEQFFIFNEIFNDFELESLITEDKIIEISKEVFEKIAYRQTTGGIIGVYKQKTSALSFLKSKKNPPQAKHKKKL